MSGPPPAWQFGFSAYVALATGHMSVLCSSLIIYSILGPGRTIKLKKPHMRLLLAMSLYDFFYSWPKSWAFMTSPPESGWPEARGNMASCRFQGFFIVFAHATGSYNAMLSTYFYMTICRGVKAETWVRYERIFHVFIFTMFMSLSIIGVIIKVYNPIFAFCFISSFPPGCEMGPGSPPCERWPPETIGYMHEIWGQGAVQISIAVVCVTNYLIWRKIKRQGQAMERYCVNQPTQPNGRSRSFGVRASFALRKKREMDARAKRERMVFNQCLLFSSVFVLCFLGPTVFHLAGWIWDYQHFWQIAVLSAFTPLQGVFNAVIYGRPIYLRIRNKFPHLSRWKAFKRIWFVADPFVLEEPRTNTKDTKDSQSAGGFVKNGAFAKASSGKDGKRPTTLSYDHKNTTLTNDSYGLTGAGAQDVSMDERDNSSYLMDDCMSLGNENEILEDQNDWDHPEQADVQCSEGEEERFNQEFPDS